MRVPAPTLPTVAPQAIPAPREQIDANPAAFGGLQGAAEVQGAGQLRQGADELGQAALMRQQLVNETAAMQGLNWLEQQHTDVLHNPQTGFLMKRGQDALNAYPDVQKQLQDLYQQARDALPNDAARRLFDSQAMRSTRYAIMQAGSHVDQQTQQWATQTAEATIANTINTGALSWNDDGRIQYNLGRIAAQTANLGQLTGASDETVKANAAHYQSEFLSAVTRQAMAAEVAGTVPTGTAQAIFDRYKDRMDAAHLAQTGSAIESHNYTLMLRQQAAEMRAERAAVKATAGARLSIETSVQNAAAMIGDGRAPEGLPSPDAIRAAYPNDPQRAEMVVQQVGDLKSLGGFVARLPSMTHQDIIDATDALQPKAGDPDYAQKSRLSRLWLSAVDGYEKSLAADPAGRVLQDHPDVKTAFDAAVQNPATFGDYAAKTLAVQSMVGIPPVQQHLMPAATAAATAAQITGSPEQAPQKLKQLAQQFGPQWGAVWHDLVTLGKLPPAYQAVGALDDEGQAALLARALAEQGKSGKTLADLLPPKARSGASGIDQRIETDTNVRNLLTSLSRSGASASMQDGIMGAIKTLAYANVVYAGKQVPDAVDTAIKAFTDQYEFLPNGGARVPRAKADAVSRNAGAVLGALTADKIAVPAIYGQQGMPKPDEYIDLLKASPSWITSPKSDAIWLMDPYGRLVRDRGGKPISVPFSGAPVAGDAVPNPFASDGAGPALGGAL